MTNSHGTFATTINCMDGRALAATHAWLKTNYAVDYIDSITEPGMDAWIQNVSGEGRAWLKRKIEISTKGHGSRIITVVAHDECAGNPVTPNIHAEDIKKAISVIHSITNELELSDVLIIPLWVYQKDGAWIAERV